MTQADDLERHMLSLINEARANVGAAPLQLELNLNASAEAHSLWMLDMDIFSHTGVDGSSATQRMASSGFDFSGSWSSAENIAVQSERGSASLMDDVFDLHVSLMNSSGHRANILNPDLAYVGIGIELGNFDFSSGTFESVMVTQNFASTQGQVDLDTGSTIPEPPATETAELLPSSGNEVLTGTAGSDTFEGLAGNDVLDGGAGTDTAIYSGNQASYTLTLSPTSNMIEDRRANGNGIDELIDMELLDFDSGVVDPFDLTVFGGPTILLQQDFESFIELYTAYFNRAPDAIGLNFWGTAFANGTTLEEMATLFVDQPETLAAYPEGTPNTVFAETVFNNVLGRTPDQAGLDFWVGDLDAGDVSRDQFILEVLRGAKSELKPELGQAFVDQQLADQAFLTTKTDIGAYFAVHKGMSDVDNASAAMALFDGTEASIDTTVTAIDSYYADALDPTTGEFIMKVVGVLDNPFAGV